MKKKNRQATSPPLLPPPQSTARLAYCCFIGSVLAYSPTAVPGPRLLLIPYREQLKYITVNSFLKLSSHNVISHF